MLDELIKLANILDENGQTEEANKIDMLIQKISIEKDIEFGKHLPPGKYVSEPEGFMRDDGGERHPAYIDDTVCEDCKTPMPLKVLKSNGGFYIGRACSCGPYSRESGYFKNEQDAESELKSYLLAANASFENIFNKLSEIANTLDMTGLTKEADLLDQFIKKTAEDVMKWKDENKKTEQSKRYDSKHHHSLQINEPKREQERVDREGRKTHHIETYNNTNVVSLSTRHCPDHIGYSLGRVGESTYQCPLDGQIYNWEAGWTDYQGNKHPGGSVAGQTPGASDYGTPHRIFDSRENTINRGS